MNRKLSPSGRAAAFPLPASPVRRVVAMAVSGHSDQVAEGRRGRPNRADIDAIVKRTVDTMVPIFKREREIAVPTNPQPEPPAPEPSALTPPRSIFYPMLPVPPPMQFEPLPGPTPDPKDKVPPSRYPGQNIG